MDDVAHGGPCAHGYDVPHGRASALRCSGQFELCYTPVGGAVLGYMGSQFAFERNQPPTYFSRVALNVNQRP